MIKLPPRALPPALQAMLDDRQATLDALPDYAARVAAAKLAWEASGARASRPSAPRSA